MKQNCYNFTYLQDFFEQTSDILPNAPALDDNGMQFTYEYLERRANRIANLLHVIGCGANDRVCILTGKNINAYSGVLGALKSGSCWVPMDINLPESRLNYIIDLLEPAAIICEEDTVKIAQENRDRSGGRFKLICLGSTEDKQADFNEKDIERQSSKRFQIDRRTAEDLAYIIFTSGSTGNPKGVMVLHRNIVQFLKVCNGFLQLRSGLRFAHHSELTFDPSLFDLFHCWGTGGTLVPFNRRRYRIDPHAFIRDTRVNVWFSVPSVITAMHRAGQIGSPHLKSLSHLLLTGEPVSPELVNLWRDAYPDCTVYNVYGTTETAIFSHWHIFKERLEPDQPIPVGRPLPDLGVLLLDDNKPVTEGKPGECVFYGSQISPGYWRNEAESKTRFIHNPFNSHLPQTFYRSGDLLRKRPDGVYEYLGRVDRQVKVRGHRIELREVENTIIQFPGVEEVAVVAVQQSGDLACAHLVAFIAAGNDTVIDDLKEFLKDRLPVYMIPARFIRVKGAIQRNDNNKIDLQALTRIAEK